MKKSIRVVVFLCVIAMLPGWFEGFSSGTGNNYLPISLASASDSCGAYVAPGVWKEFDCYNLAAIGKTTNDDPFSPSWRLIGGYWQWGRMGPDSGHWYNTNTPNFAHGPTGPDSSQANSGSISGWDQTAAPDGSWSQESRVLYYLLDKAADQHKKDGDGDGEVDLLLNINTNGIRFRVNDGPELSISFNKDLLLAPAETYQTGKVITHADFVAALQPGLAQLIADGSVPSDTTLFLDRNLTVFTYLDDGSRSSDIPAIILRTQTENILTVAGFVWAEGLDGDYNVYGQHDSDSEDSNLCPAGFQMPTKSQWQGVVENNVQRTAGSWSESWDDYTNYSSARFFGDNLMLPAAGLRNYALDGGLFHRGLMGNYWSRTASSNNDGGQLYFSDTEAEVGSSSRLFGLSVRCMADSDNPPPCTYQLSRTNSSFNSGSESHSVSVTASNSGCAWTTSNTLPWVTVSPTSGTGSGSVTVSVAANTGAARSGSITIAGQPYAISQAGRSDHTSIILTQTSPDHTITSGSDVQVYGTASSNQITLESGAKAELINFHGFNTVQIQSDSDAFKVFRSGTVVTFQGTDGTVLKIPASTSVHTITFVDRAPLTLSIYSGKVMLDDQVVTTDPSPIDVGQDSESTYIDHVWYEQANEDNQFEIISGYDLESESAQVMMTDGSQPDTISFSLISGPAGMAIDSTDGRITYETESDTIGTFVYSIKATTLNSEFTLSGEIIVIQPLETFELVTDGTSQNITDTQGRVLAEIPEGAIEEGGEVVLKTAVDQSGNPMVTIEVSGAVSENARLIVNLEEIQSVIQEKTIVRNLFYSPKLSTDDYCDSYSGYEWATNDKWFWLGSYREPEDRQHAIDIYMDGKSSILFKKKTASVLCSERAIPDSSQESDKEPVLFIHGYTKLNTMGGGTGTWGNMFQYLKDTMGDVEIEVFEFRWRTNTRFQDVAKDFQYAVDLIKSKTGNNVHIVAHSFGGIVSRAYLQGLAYGAEENDTHPVASLSTIGTPHSGIFPTRTGDHPNGTDGVTGNKGIPHCHQISCYQMGAGVDGDANITARDESEPGSMFRLLQNSDNEFSPSNLQTQVLIGLRLKDTALIGQDYVYSDGDGLISFEGQRFDKYNALNGASLSREESLSGAIVTEYALSDDSVSASPEDNALTGHPGYGHTKVHKELDLVGSIKAEKAEVWIDDGETDHATLGKLKDWIETNSSATVSSECGAYVTEGIWKKFDCYNLAAIGKTTNDDPFTPSWRLIGGYWQWGRKGPDPSQWYNNNTEHFAHGPTGPSSSEANSGEISEWDSSNAPDGAWSDSDKTANDPCPDGSRVPTRAQLDGILVNNTQSRVGTWSPYGTNYSSALFFGSELMLPAAGYRWIIGGSLGKLGEGGEYWSSSEDFSGGAWYLGFGMGGASTNNYGSRKYGLSVRCVAE